MQVYTAADLFKTLSIPAVQAALVFNDISLANLDGASRSLVFLQRNVTISGAYADPGRWPTLDLAYVQNMVKLGPGVTLTITQLAVWQWRLVPHFQALGFDLVQGNGTAAEPAFLVVKNTALIQRTCLPISMIVVSNNAVPRPAALPGRQVADRLPQSPDCVNSSSVPAMHRCWPAIGMYNDTATYATNLDSFGKVVPAGYILQGVLAYYLCETVMTDECVAQRGGPVGCFNSMFIAGKPPPPPTPPSQLPPPPLAAAPRPASGSHRSLLAPLLGGILGGVAATAVAVGLVALLVRRRPRQTGKPAPSAAVTTSLEERRTAVGEPDGPSQGGEGVPKARAKGNPAGVTASWALCSTEDASRSVDASAAHAVSHAVLLSSNAPSLHTGSAGLQGPDPACSSFVAAVHPARPPVSDMELVPVTPLTPVSPHIDMSVRLGTAANEVQLLPAVLGKGACGRVVVGLYRGERVAVKLLDTGLAPSGVAVAAAAWAAAAVASASAVREAAPEKAAETVAAVTPDVAVAAAASEAAAATAAPGVATEAAAAPVAAAGATTAQVSQGAAQDGSGICCSLPKHEGSGGDFGYTESTAACGGGGAVGPAVPDVVINVGLQCNNASSAGAATLAGRAFGQEVAVLARCQHPNVIRLLAASLEPSRPCLVMELMETCLDRVLYGGSLGPVASKAGGPAAGSVRPGALLPLPKVIHIAMQTARALSYLHPTVLHRDLKPANVLISAADSDQPVVKLADFGLSRLRNTVLVTQNTEVGTAPYISPEAFEPLNCVITDRSDIYALGVIIWEMLSGTRPWEGKNTAQIAYTVAFQRERLPLSAVPYERCPLRLASLIRACWDPVPARRPAAAEVVKSLALVQQELKLAPADTVCKSGVLLEIEMV